MDAAGQQRRGGSIHEAVSLQRREAGEAAGDDAHGEMTAFAGTGMAGMRGTVVAQGKVLRREGLPQQRLQLSGHRAHDLSLPLKCSHMNCPTTNSSREPINSGIFTLTQVSSETL